MATKYASYAQVQSMVDGVIDGVKTGYATKDELSTLQNGLASYSLVKRDTAVDTYAATYDLKKTIPAAEEGGDPTVTVEGTINIPKDYLVKSGQVKTATAEDAATAGVEVGDKYLDFVVNASDNAGTESHIYIPVNDLVDVYNGSAAITVGDDNSISLKVVESNGLSIDSTNGLTLALAAGSDNSDEENPVAAKAGAMSGADKDKLDSIAFATDAEVQAYVESMWDDETP